MKETQLNKKSLLYYLFSLTLVFVIFELVVFVQSSEFFLTDFKRISLNIKIPARVFAGIFWFILIQAAIHVFFTLTVYFLSLSQVYLFDGLKKHLDRVGLIVWLLAILTLLVVNQQYYPNSVFSIVTSKVVFLSLLKPLLYTLFLIMGFLFFTSICGLLKYSLQRSFNFTIILLFAVAAAMLFQYSRNSKPLVNVSKASQAPNIIIIGFDSFRTDFLGLNGKVNITPHIDAFLKDSILFTNSYTPIARTFPAWVSILTGNYPKTSGIRFNLADQAGLDKTQALPVILKNNGYRTLYAIDDASFSNIDESFGFDAISTPPIGFSGFLLASINDFPMSNLVLNSKIGQYIFPHSYANRSAVRTYSPSSYTNKINKLLLEKDSKPILLTAHFCLLHYPYYWAGSKFKKSATLEQYLSALQKVDRQFKHLIDLLNERQLLNNALVFVISDHGEAINLVGDRITENKSYLPSKSYEQLPQFYLTHGGNIALNSSVGHGTDVLSVTQNNTLFAMRFFSSASYKPKKVDSLISLVDLKPTVLDFLGIDYGATDGVTLMPLVHDIDKTFINRSVFVETGFSPAAILTTYPNTRDLLFQGANYFHVDKKTLRLKVKPDMGELIISSKQYASYHKNWILALYPKEDNKMLPVLVNTKTGYWSVDLNSDFANNSPADLMLDELQEFFGSELKEIS